MSVSTDFFVENLRVSTLTLPDTAARICEAAGTDNAWTVFTLNLDHVVKMRKDPAFYDAYTRAGLITADGLPVVLAGGLKGKRFGRVTGADLVEPICARAAKTGKSVYLFGSTPEVLAQASAILRARNPGLQIAGTMAPPLGFSPRSESAKSCLEAIAKSDADLCFVALGAPKQEFFADFGKQLCPNVSFVCIGAALDFITGAQVRAPRWMQLCGLEWLWRAATNPRRLLQRYAACMAELPRFLTRAALSPQPR